MSIEITGIKKQYGSVQALKNVSVAFEEGKIYALLGRNGAGKTTLLNIITNRIFADQGHITVDGMPAPENDAAQRRIYMLGEKNHFPEKMRVKDAYKWTKAFYPSFDEAGARRIAELFELDTRARIKALSTGYATIFKLSIALAVDVPYVLLDEPILGLDAHHRELFYKLLIEKYSEKPFTAVISTHLIEEISGLVEHVVIIKDGRIIRDEPRDELLKIGYTISGVAAQVDSYIEGRGVIGTDALGGLKTAYLMGEPDMDGLPQGLEVSKPDLQKLFIRLTDAKEGQ